MKTYLILLATLLSSCSACSTTKPAHSALPTAPPSSGYIARVKPGRAVACVLDQDMDARMCEEVAQAVTKINRAVGYELLQHPTVVRPEVIMGSSEDDEVTYVGVDRLPEGVLGVTYLKRVEVGTGYLKRVLVLYSPMIWGAPGMRESVVLHELLHSIGCEHAAQQGPFPSIESPSWTPGAPSDLTPADLVSIRAAYPAL